jgi:amidohydrolase
MTGALSNLRERLSVEAPAAVELRHELHRHPDLSGDEAGTLARVLQALPDAAAARPVADTGAVLRIGGAGPAVAVRAELDALPVTEATGLPWASQRPGTMHACGHDVHLAALVALARAVAAAEHPSPLLVVLQPREESAPSGAQDIVLSGLLQQEEVHAVIGAHVQPALPGGTVVCTPGAVNASNDEFTIVVEGSGGHAAYPHETVDPVVALAQVILSLQTVVSRSTDPLAAAVVSVTMLSAGRAQNVIPPLATAGGTLRTLGPSTRRSVQTAMRHVISLTARAHGCEGRLELSEGEPTLVNDGDLARRTAPLLQRLGSTVDSSYRSMGADDFAHFSTVAPSLMMFVGTGGAQLHTPAFAPADDHVEQVARALLAGYLAAAAGQPGSHLPGGAAPKAPS